MSGKQWNCEFRSDFGIQLHTNQVTLNHVFIYICDYFVQAHNMLFFDTFVINHKQIVIKQSVNEILGVTNLKKALENVAK